MRNVAWFCLIVVLGCSSTAEPPVSPETPPPVSPQGGHVEALPPALPPVELTPEEEAWFDGAYNDADYARTTGDYAQALGIIDGALERDPPHEHRGRLEALRYRVRGLFLRNACLDGFVRLDRRRYTIGDIIRAELVLMNISTKEVRIVAARALAKPVSPPTEVVDERHRQNAKHARTPRGETTGPQEGEGVSRTILRASARYREHRPDYTLFETDNNQNVAVDADIVLASGESIAIPIEVDTAEINKAGTMFRTYSFGCTLYPTEVVVGDDSFHGKVEFREATAGVFPRNWEHLAGDPPGRMREALRKNSPLHLTLAAALLAKGDHESVLAWCGEQLRRPELSEASTRGIMASLRIITGESLAASAEEWIRWLQQRR